MAGKFPLYTDADIRGSLVKGLRERGWDVVRAVEAFPEGTDDDVHFEKAAELGRVYVMNDRPSKRIANRWLREGRRFTGVITWPQVHYRRMSDGDFLDKFEELAAKNEPFDPAYPVVHFKAD